MTYTGQGWSEDANPLAPVKITILISFIYDKYIKIKENIN